MSYCDPDRELGKSSVEGIVEEGKMDYDGVKALLHRLYANECDSDTSKDIKAALLWLYDSKPDEECDVDPNPSLPKGDIIDGLLRARYELGCEESEMMALSKEYHDRIHMSCALDAAIEELSK